MNETLASCLLPTHDYDLAATLTSGQAFRGVQSGPGWTGVLGRRWVRLESVKNGICAHTIGPVSDWSWASEYLRANENLDRILGNFPDDEPMRRAVSACRGLRLLRQEPWECLASFILSSTKQIVQIRQVIGFLCERYGEPLKVPAGFPPTWAFPTAERLASTSERALRACRMGFRAAYLLNAARQVAKGSLDLERVRALPLEAAREELMRLSGYVLPGASDSEPGPNVGAALFADLTDDERDELLEYLAWYRTRRRTSRGAAAAS